MLASVMRYGGASAVVGGLLWAVTPLRQPIFGAGRSPEEGVTFFRVYNLVIVIVAVLLTIALVRLRRDPTRSAGRLLVTGWWTILVGHALILLGSLPAVLVGDEPRSLVMGGQDLGFLAAMVAGLGGLGVGVSIVRHPEKRSDVAAWLLLLTLPLGFLVLTLLSAMGLHEDYLGLPLTILYGGAWVTFGSSWIRERPANTPRAP